MSSWADQSDQRYGNGGGGGGRGKIVLNTHNGMLSKIHPVHVAINVHHSDCCIILFVFVQVAMCHPIYVM